MPEAPTARRARGPARPACPGHAVTFMVTSHVSLFNWLASRPGTMLGTRRRSSRVVCRAARHWTRRWVLASTARLSNDLSPRAWPTRRFKLVWYLRALSRVVGPQLRPRSSRPVTRNATSSRRRRLRRQLRMFGPLPCLTRSSRLVWAMRHRRAASVAPTRGRRRSGGGRPWSQARTIVRTSA